MINCNGELLSSTTEITNNNRGFLYGDAVFETFKFANNTILFLEDHYFRLMESMRIVLMEIPMHFTMEYIEEQLLNLLHANAFKEGARIRMTVYRNEGGLYLPTTKTISYLIQAFPLQNP